MFSSREQQADWRRLMVAMENSPEVPACTNDPDLFFPDHNTNQGWSVVAWACADCPIRRECAEYGIKWATTGIWGGLNGQERSAIRRSRGLTARANPNVFIAD